MLILLMTTLCVGDNIKPFTNTEMRKILLLFKSKNYELSHLYNKSNAELLDIFQLQDNLIGHSFVERITNLLGRQGSLAFDLVDIKEWGINIVTIFDETYPKKILNTLNEKAPYLLYYAGDLNITSKRLLGFSGSRLKANDKSINDYVKGWVDLAYSKNYGIVSGGAKGIDTYAADAAILNEQYLVEFLSDSLFKKVHNARVSKMIREGKMLLLSEVNPYAGFNAGMAMSRNKYIYALSEKVIVPRASYTIKGTLKTGGTWNGVIENLKHENPKAFVWERKIANNKELISMGAYKLGLSSEEDSVNYIFGNEVQHVYGEQISLLEFVNNDGEN